MTAAGQGRVVTAMRTAWPSGWMKPDLLWERARREDPTANPGRHPRGRRGAAPPPPSRPAVPCSADVPERILLVLLREHGDLRLLSGRCHLHRVGRCGRCLFLY